LLRDSSNRIPERVAVEGVGVTSAEEHILKIALEQTVVSGVFSAHLTTFDQEIVRGSEIKTILKQLERKDLVSAHGLTSQGYLHVFNAGMIKPEVQTTLDQHNRAVLRTLLDPEIGLMEGKGIPFAKLSEVSPVSYSLLIVVLADLEREGMVTVDRRRLVYAGQKLRSS
jgi:hypothetical protein